MYTQVRHMRITSATYCQDDEGHGKWFVVEVNDGKNILYLNDVAISDGPVKVGDVMRVTIEPVNPATGR